MSARFISLVVASHLAAVLAGLWTGRPSGGESHMTDAPPSPSVRRPVRPVSPVSTPAAAFQSTSEWSSREFSAAWKALRRERLTRTERARIQRRLLVDWAERDLASSIEAALGEEWNDESNQEVLRTTLFDVFLVPFVENPQAAWDMIASGRFGIDTGLLRSLWIEAAGEVAPFIVVARIGDLPAESRQEALNACSADFYDDTDRAKAVRILSKLPEGTLTEKQLADFARPRAKE